MSEPSANGARYRLSEAVVARAVGDEMLLLDLETGVYHSLNEVATVLYRRLEGGATREQLVAALIDEFEVDEGRAREDVDIFIADEMENGLVRHA